MARLLVVLLALVLTACEPPQTESRISLPAPDSDGAQLLKKFCSDCHAPPSPLAHTAKEWPNVVYRMQERRRMKTYELIGEDEQAILIEYLETFAKR